MSAYSKSLVFPDLNVWIALTSSRHTHSRVAIDWYESLGEERLVFCRYSQLGFLRLLTTEAVMGEDVLTQSAAWAAYDRWLESGTAVLNEEPANLEIRLRSFARHSLSSPKEWADAYLAAFSIAAGIRLVTFDRGLKARVSDAILLKP
jgi:toxin-antitoxin system PIN domain toxin